MSITLGTVVNRPLFWNAIDRFNQMANAAAGTEARQWWDTQINPQITDTNVAHPSVYGEMGLGSLIEFERTGATNTTLATQIHDILLASETDGVADRNWERGYTIQAANTTFLIWSALTADQQQDLFDMLQRLVNIFMGVGTPDYAGGFRVSDTDQTIGQFWGIMIIKLYFPDITFPTTTGGGGNFKYILGGLDSTGSDQTSVRNAIRQMIDTYAAGGEWIVSSGYNVSDDVQLLQLAYITLLDITGVDHMPEMVPFVKQNAIVLIHDVTPDLADAAKWGDTQAPDLGVWDYIVALALTRATLARMGEAKLASWIQFRINEIYAKYGDVYPTRWNPEVVLWLDPFAPSADYRAELPRTVDCSAGIGQVTRHDGWTLDGTYLHVMSPNSKVQVDHECFYLLSPQIYANGEWMLRNPVGYGPADTAEILNSVRFGGQSVMERFGIIAVQDDPNFLMVVAATSGKPGVTGQYNQPDRFVNEGVRIFFYLPAQQCFVMVDRMNLDDPRLWTPAQIASYPVIQKGIAGCSLKEVLYNSPNGDAVTSPTGATWKTPGGRPVRMDCYSTGGALSVVQDDIFTLPDVDPNNLNALDKGMHRLRYGSDRAGFEAIVSVFQWGANQVVPVPISVSEHFGFQIGDALVLFSPSGGRPALSAAEGVTDYLVGTDASGKWGVTVQTAAPVVVPTQQPAPSSDVPVAVGQTIVVEGVRLTVGKKTEYTFTPAGTP